ncbi:MAG: ECF transporter S component [Selenomonadaceae bacterium]
MKDNFSLRRLTIIGILGAISAILMFINFPLPFVPPFYRFDAAELPALFGAFFLGPSAGVLIISLKLLVKLLIQGSDTLLVGEMANFMANVAFVLPAALIYQRHKTKRAALWGMTAGTLASSLFSVFGNAYIAIPLFAAVYGWPVESIIKMGTAVNPYITDMTTMMLWAVLPFNLIKCAFTSSVMLLIYKKAAGALRSYNDGKSSQVL